MKRSIRFSGMVSRRLQAGSAAVVAAAAALGVDGVDLLRGFFVGEEDEARDTERLVAGDSCPDLGRRVLLIPLLWLSSASSSSLRFSESVEREREGEEAAATAATELLVTLGGVYENCSSFPLKLVGISSSSTFAIDSVVELPRRELVSSFMLSCATLCDPA